MRRMGLVTMDHREIQRLRVIQDLISQRTTVSAAAQLLSVTHRQIRNLKTRFIEHGPSGLASRRRGKPSNRRLPETLRHHAINIVRTYYADFGPTFACQKLREQHRIHVSIGTLRAWMMSEGIWLHKIEQRKRVHQPRYRRECYGELVQIDGSQHWWFEDRAPKCTLLVFIDDATSKLMHLKFVPTESAFAYFEATTEYLEMHGKPVAFYSDKHSIFRVTNKSAVGGNGMTQFGRALHELNIDIICANTPQAKGRVERANRTLQDRLVKELRLAWVTGIEAGNALLPTFIADYNSRFSRLPLNDKDLHRQLEVDESLRDIFVWREERTVSQNLTLQFDKALFMLEPGDVASKLAGKRATVSLYPSGRIMISYEGLPLSYQIFDKVRQVNQAAIVDNKRLAAALEHIQKEQAKRPMYRSEKAPRWSAVSVSPLAKGGPISQKRKTRKAASNVINLSNKHPMVGQLSEPKPFLSYEDDLCLAIGRRVQAEKHAEHERKLAARRNSRADGCVSPTSRAFEERSTLGKTAS